MLFILDKNHEVVGSLNSNGDLSRITTYFDDEYVQDLGTGAETFQFSTMADTQQAQHLVAGNFVAFKEDDEFKLFNIIQIEESHEDVFIKTVYCEMAGIELINEIIRPMKILSSSLRKYLTTILADTEWQLGRIDMGFTQVYDFEVTDYKSVYELIQEHVVGTFGAEISYRVEIEHGRIVGKYIDCYVQRGKEEGFRFAYGSNLTSVTRTVDMSNLATALIGVGKSGLTFKEVETGDKPLNQDFIVNEVAFKQWNINGSHIFGIHKEETDSPQELLKLTRQALEERGNPQVKYEMKVELLGKEVKIGDTVNIVDHEFNPPLYLSARVNQLKRSKTDPHNDEVVLANFKEVRSNITDEMRNLASQLEGYVDGQFPIGGDKIQNGAINGDKLSNGQIIQGTHLFANSVTADKIKAGSIETDHLQAGIVTADKVTTGELITLSAQIGDAVISSAHIKEGTIDSVHINEGSINSAHIQDASIGTAQIKDAEITVAKIESAFIDKLVAKEGKFESAHIGVLTADNIDANTINAEHIKASVIDAINMNVEGKITADRIDVSSLEVDEIDAGKITSGTVDADRINGSVITAINASIENATIDSAKIGDLSADKITSGSIDTDILKANIIDAINMNVSGKISADRIDVNSLVVDDIDASKITTGDLDAERISTNVINAIHMNTGKISADNIDVDGIRIGNANIVDGTILGAKIEKGTITNAEISDAFIADAHIKNLSANVIKSGTLDAMNIEVKNLRADSITTGSITVEGNNLLHGTGFKEFNEDGWYSVDVQNGLITIDTENKYHATNSIKFTDACNIYSEFVETRQGETFVISLKSFIKSETAPANPLLVVFEEFDESSNTRIAYQESAISSTTDEWTQYVQSWKVKHENTKRVRVRLYNRVTGLTWVSQPMLSRGSLASIWKLHVDELLSDGSINNEHIADESITSNKLMISEIWAEQAWIDEFNAQTINADKITTGKIQGQYLDLEGIVKFSHLDKEMADNFIVGRDEQGNISNTWINGEKIYAHSIEGDKIDTRGFTARNSAREVTFNIDKDTGEVSMSGTVQSMNFSDVKGKEVGYRLTPDGTAILNDAKISGSVLLPNSGITDEGKTNLLPHTDFSTDVSRHYKLRGSNMTLAYNQEDGGFLTVRNTTLDADEGGVGLLTPAINGGLKANAKYTITFKARSASNLSTLDYIYIMSNETDIANQSIGSVRINAFDSWEETQTLTFTPSRDYPKASLLIGYRDAIITGNTNQKGFSIKNIMLVEGDKGYTWLGTSPVRFWAGTDYDNRHNAPFRVLQDGTIISTKGEFNGTVTGSIDIGNIRIEDDNNSKGSLTLKTNNNSKEVIRLNEDLTYIDTNFIIGNDLNRIIEYNKEVNKLTSSVPIVISEKRGVEVEFANTEERLTVMHSSHDVGDHWQKYYNGSYIFDSRGTQTGADFQFEKMGNTVPVKVSVTGEIHVRDKITMNNNIAIVSRQDVGNSGFDYVVK